MAPRCEDEPSDPRPDDPPSPGPTDDGPSDQAEPTSAQDGDEAWAQIVARLGDIDIVPGPVGPRVVRPGRAEELDDDPGTGRDWDGTTQMDRAEREVDDLEHFVPPDPGPVLGGSPLLTAAWAAVVCMPVLWLVVAIAWRTAPRSLLQASGVVFVLAIGVLLWQMPHRRSPDDEDDGAVV